jgi:hypothetical protein
MTCGWISNVCVYVCMYVCVYVPLVHTFTYTDIHTHTISREPNLRFERISISRRFRCLVGHVCETCGPVTRKTVWAMVDVSQVMIDHPIIYRIHASRLTTLLCSEVSCRYTCTKILAFLSRRWNSSLLSCSFRHVSTEMVLQTGVLTQNMDVFVIWGR